MHHVKQLIVLSLIIHLSVQSAYAQNPGSPDPQSECSAPAAESADTAKIVEYAQCLKQKQRYYLAIDYLHSASQQVLSARIQALLSEVYFLNGEVEQSLAAASRSLELDADYMPGKWWLAMASFRRGMQISPTQLLGLNEHQPEECQPSEFEISQMDAVLAKELYLQAYRQFNTVAESDASSGIRRSARQMAAQVQIAMGDMSGGLEESERIVKDILADFNASGDSSYADKAALMFATMSNQATASAQSALAARYAEDARFYASSDLVRQEVGYVLQDNNSPELANNRRQRSGVCAESIIFE